MSIIVTASEHFERSKTWFIAFGLVFVLMIILCMMTNNIVWAILLCLLMGGYMYYILRSDETIQISIQDVWLQIWVKVVDWSKLSGFVIEYHIDRQTIHNLVLLYTDGTHHIYSFVDTTDHITDFVQQLANYIPFQSNFTQTFVQQILRRIKL